MNEPLHLSELAGDIIAYDVDGHGVFVMVGTNHKDYTKANTIINRINACAGISNEEVKLIPQRTLLEKDEWSDFLARFDALKAQLDEAVELLMMGQWTIWNAGEDEISEKYKAFLAKHKG